VGVLACEKHILELTEASWLRLLVVADPDVALVRAALKELPPLLDAAADADLAERLRSANGAKERTYAEFAYRFARLVPIAKFSDDEVARVLLAFLVASLRDRGRRASNVLQMLDFGHLRKNAVRGTFGVSMPFAKALASSAGVKAGAPQTKLLETASIIEASVRFNHAACYAGLLDRAAKLVSDGKFSEAELAALQTGYASHHAEEGMDGRRLVEAIDGRLDLHRVAVDDATERAAVFKFKADLEATAAQGNLGQKALGEFLMDMIPGMVLQAIVRTRPDKPRWRQPDFEHGCKRCPGPVCQCLSQFRWVGCVKVLMARWFARPGHRYQSTIPQQLAALEAEIGHCDPYVSRSCARVIGESATGGSAWGRGNGCGWEYSMLQEMLGVLLTKLERGLDPRLELAALRVIAASLRDDTLRAERWQRRLDSDTMPKRRELSQKAYEALVLRLRAMRRTWSELHAAARRNAGSARVPGYTTLSLRKEAVDKRLAQGKMECRRTAEALASDPAVAFLMKPTSRVVSAPSLIVASTKSKVAGSSDAPVAAAQREAHLRRLIAGGAEIAVPRPNMEHDVVGGSFEKVAALDVMIVPVY